MKIKAVTLNPRAIPKENRCFTAYHKCINSSRCNKLFGLIFLMSIGTIFTAVIVMAVIRADLFDINEKDPNERSNTTHDTADSLHVTIDEIQTLNVTNEDLQLLEPFHEFITSTSELITTGENSLERNDNSSDTTIAPVDTTSTSTISFVVSTQSEGTTSNIPPIVNPPRCNIQSSTQMCLISCVYVESQKLFIELTRAIEEDLIGSTCPMHNLHLLLDSIRFPIDGNDRDWLDGLNTINTISFVNLTITRSEFEELSPNSFANGPFTGVNHIIISEMDILRLQNNSFNGLTSLSSLTFTNVNTFTPLLGFNLLSVSSSLITLTVTGTWSNWNIHRLTGGNNDFKKIEVVDLSNNNLASSSFNFTLTGVSTVKYIYLQYSRISQLSANTFVNCTNLEVIDLSYNNLLNLPQTIFERLANLRHLYLSGNQLENLPDGLLSYQRINSLVLSNNPWQCNHEIIYLKKLLETTTINFNGGGTNSICAGPENLAGIRINDLWCSETRCKISCTNTDQTTLEKVLEIYTMTNCTTVTVELYNHKFPNKQIPSYWLSNLSYSIHVLNMISTSIVNFENNAFNSSTFHPLKVLKIDTKGTFMENTVMLTKQTFAGLNEIETLEVIRLPQIGIEESDVFEVVSSSLVDLTIAHCSLIFLQRLFENTTFVRLETLNLTGNNFFGSTIAPNTFTGIHGSVKELYMSESRIQNIHPGTFDNFQNLEELDLRNNILQSLPNGLFNIIKATNPNFTVYLQENSWNCTTELCHLLPYITEDVLCSSGDPMMNLYDSCTTTTTNTKPTEEEPEESTTTTEETPRTEPETSPTEEITSTSVSEESTSSSTTETPITDESTTEETTTGKDTPTIEVTNATSSAAQTTSNVTKSTSTTTEVTHDSSSTTTSRVTTPTTTLSETAPITTTKTTEETTPETITSTLTTGYTTTMQETTSNIPGNGYFDIPCLEGTLNITNILGNFNGITLLSRDSITVYRPPVLFTIQQTKPNEVIVTFDRKEEGMVLLYYPVYFNPFDMIVDDPNDPRCVNVANEVINISDLLPNTIYTFCSLFNIAIFTPFQCISHANTDGMPWLYEEQRPVIITSLTLIFLLVLVAGILMTYFLIRRMPTLIRGSKRVVMVNNKSKEVMILPRSTDSSRSNSYRKESVVTPIVPEPPTYMTPLPRQSIEHRSPIVRSTSDTSLKSYVSVSRLPPRFSQVYQLGDFDNCSSRYRNGSFPRQIPSVPYQQSPELPPPLPRRSVVSTASSSAHQSIASTAEIGKLSRSNNHHNSTFRHRPNRCEVEEENHYNIII